MIFTHVSSSNLEGVAVNGNNLVIRFINGRVYEYTNAACEFYNIINASSKGKYFHNFIEPYYFSRKIN